MINPDSRDYLIGTGGKWVCTIREYPHGTAYEYTTNASEAVYVTAAQMNTFIRKCIEDDMNYQILWEAP